MFYVINCEGVKKQKSHQTKGCLVAIHNYVGNYDESSGERLLIYSTLDIVL